jgi:DNA ligase-1
MTRQTWLTRIGALALALQLLRPPALASAEDTARAGAEAAHDEPREDAASSIDATVRAPEPAVTLAEVYAPGIDPTAYLVSEKFDGVRAYWDGRRLITRGGLVINAPAWFTEGLPPRPLDGELWMGRGTFARVSGTVRRHQPDPEAWHQVRYVLFDLPASDAPFAQRAEALEELVAASPNPRLKLAQQTRVADHAALQARLEQVVAEGGEGLMLHHRDAIYRPGRSDRLLKLKPYFEGEATVLEHLPGEGKYAGMLGSMLVEEPDGTRFRLGTGFTDAERAAPPPIGSEVSFKYHGRTKNGLPRFASFLRVADDL